MIRSMHAKTALLGLVLCVLLPTALQASQEIPVTSENWRKVSGWCEIAASTISIAGQIYDGHMHTGWAEDYTTADIRGWDRFRAFVGLREGCRGSCLASIEVDGQQVWQKELRPGESAVLVDVPLTGRKAMTLRCNDECGIFAQPKCVKGEPAPPSASSSSASAIAEPVAAASGSATFIVDPNDLDKLATALRKRVDANAGLKTRIDQGNMALMTFELINITSKTVSKDVAENLSTSMINAGFSLVERGQLDKAVQELKLQETGLIDPATAQKLGKMTGCDFIVVGSISDQDTFVVINSRILETATGKAVAAERVELRKIKRN